MNEDSNLLHFPRAVEDDDEIEAAVLERLASETDAEAEAREERERAKVSAIFRRWEIDGQRRRLYDICRHTEDPGFPVPLSDDDLRDLLWLLTESLSGRSFVLESWERKWIGTELERALRAGRVMGGGKRGPHKHETAYEEIGRICLIYRSFFEHRETEEYYAAAESTAEFMTANGYKMEASTVKDRVTECNALLGPSWRWGALETRVERLAKKLLAQEKEKKWKRDPGFAIPPDLRKPPV